MDAAYWGEFRTNWRPLLAATLGLGFGMALNAYTASLFAAELIKEFDWSHADFALMGTLALLMLVVSPIVGRLTDLFGVRKVAAVGVVGGPALYILYMFQSGDIRIYFALSIVHIMFGAFTTSPVLTRIIAERFDKARGLAFSVAMTGPPGIGAIAAPLLGPFITEHGWRAGYGVLGIVTLFFGLIALVLIPRSMPRAIADAARPAAERRADYRLIAANPTFWTLIAAMVLVNLPQGMVTYQMKVVLEHNGATPELATWLISSFAIGVIVGRFACGLSLDRLKPHLVAALALGSPAIGLLLLASPADTTLVLSFAVAIMGMAQGAEGDIGAYLVSKRFDLRVFSLVSALMGGAIALGSSLGALTLSITLNAGGTYSTFLIICAGTTIIGASLFLALGPRRSRHQKATA